MLYGRCSWDISKILASHRKRFQECQGNVGETISNILHIWPTLPHQHVRANDTQKMSTSKTYLYPTGVSALFSAGNGEKQHFSRHSHRCCLSSLWVYVATWGARADRTSKAMAKQRTPQSEEFLCKSTSTILSVSLEVGHKTRRVIVFTVDRGIEEYIVS